MGFGAYPPLLDTDATRNGLAVYQLAGPLRFHLGLNGQDQGVSIEVPEGFLTDLASVPWYLRWLFSPSGPHRWEAILHDYLYTLPGCSRFLADAIFRDAMALRSDISAWRRIAMYYGVRLCAGRHYRRREADPLLVTPPHRKQVP